MPRLVPVQPGDAALSVCDGTVIGRSSECDVVMHDATVSRRHARIGSTSGSWEISDLGSSFGTFVNGGRVSAAVLAHGDQVKLGNLVFTFEDAADAPPLTQTTDAAASAVAVEALQREIADLRAANQRNQVLLAFQQGLARCTSIPTILSVSGPDVVRVLRADGCVILLKEGPDLRDACYLHGLQAIPGLRAADVERASQSAAVVEGASDPQGLCSLTIPVTSRNGVVLAIVYAQRDARRGWSHDEIDLGEALCAQMAAAIDNVSLQHQVRKEEQTRAHLTRYVSDQVADAIVSGKLQVGMRSERCTVSVLFLDIRGFTRISERLLPEHVFELLNDYFAVAVPAVKAANGTVDKFIGDALMAVFGAPYPMADHAMRAVSTAVHIRDAMAQLPSRWAGRQWAAQVNLSAFSVGIGINTGDAAAGNLGVEERREYTVIGDTVNIASRLCSVAAGNQVLIGGDTARAVEQGAHLRALEPISLKGKAERVEVFEVLGLLPD